MDTTGQQNGKGQAVWLLPRMQQPDAVDQYRRASARFDPRANA